MPKYLETTQMSISNKMEKDIVGIHTVEYYKARTNELQLHMG
jgi:hypothetical protein